MGTCLTERPLGCTSQMDTQMILVCHYAASHYTKSKENTTPYLPALSQL